MPLHRIDAPHNTTIVNGAIAWQYTAMDWQISAERRVWYKIQAGASEAALGHREAVDHPSDRVLQVATWV